MSLIKSQNDQRAIRKAGSILGAVLSDAYTFCEAGKSGKEVDTRIEQTIRHAGATPAFIGYDGYPSASCLSINEQVVHGIPTERIFKEGDVVGIDVGLWYDGVCVDSAVTKVIGTPTTEINRLMATTKEALKEGIKAAKPYRRVGSISAAIQTVADREKLGIVRTLVGHGVGHALHESPEVPNYGRLGDGIQLKPGMVLAIEPMFTLGKGEVEVEVDGWGIVTIDGSIAAHFEHTIIITTKGAEIVTKSLANI